MPVCRSIKHPVPYVFFACPGSKQHCPKVLPADLRRPLSEEYLPEVLDSLSPKKLDDARTSGALIREYQRATGGLYPSTLHGCYRAWSDLHWWCRLRTSPPVSIHIAMYQRSQRSSPASARSRAPATLSKIQRILLAEKYASAKTAFLANHGLHARRSQSCSTSSEVRRHCHTIALQTGAPVVDPKPELFLAGCRCLLNQCFEHRVRVW